MKKILSTDAAPEAIGAYSQAVQVGDFVFCSGQIPLDPQTMEVVGETVRDQTRQVMKNVTEVLKSADMTLENVVKTTIFLSDMQDFNAVNEIYGEYFTESPPARSCVAVRELPKHVWVEVEVVAHKG